MQSKWLNSEAKKISGNPLDLRVYTSRLLGQDPDLVLHGGGNTSVKIKEKNFFKESEEILYMKASGFDLGVIETSGFAPVRIDIIRKLIHLSKVSDTEMMQVQRMALSNPSAPDPSIETLVHAIIPFTYVDHTHADAVVAITNTEKGEQRIMDIYGKKMMIVPYVKPGFLLAKKIFELMNKPNSEYSEGMILLNHGVFTFDSEAKYSYLKMIDIVTQAEKYLKKKSAVYSFGKLNGKANLTELARIRKRVSLALKKPVIALFDNSPPAFTFSGIKKIEVIAGRGPLTPDHIIRTKRTPAILDQNPVADITGFEKEYLSYFKRNYTPGLICLDPAPRWAVWKNCGTISFGQTLKEAEIVFDIASHTVKAICRAEALSGWKALPEKDLFEIEYWELEQAKLKKKNKNPEFSGKIIIITGAASGIGKACTEIFAQNGAVVAALDINPSVKGMFHRKEILEIVCDVSDNNQLKKAVEQTVEEFGGLDIVVSNAGIFTEGSNIEEMKAESWNKSMNLNLNSHMQLFKNCIPFLKEGIEPSIVVIGSKNVPAPGPGAGAYSVAKAGLNQLARVSALELGKFGIRVNIVHPNAVYDTGIWTEDVLKSRAKHYNLSVEEYKTSNVLKTSVSSADVARMVYAMAGNTFGKTTGAQVPVDGGNERII